VSSVAQFWLLIVVLAIGTWSMRAFPIILHGRVPHPPWLERLLKHVPVAALTALVVPGSLYVREGSAYAFAPARTIAAVCALLVAWKTKSVLATLAVGMGVLWAAQWALVALG
jgi:branched-subunit amino acid transport protein